MNIECEQCGSEFTHSTKKFTKRHGKTHKIVVCPECGFKNLVPVIQRYSDKDE